MLATRINRDQLVSLTQSVMMNDIDPESLTKDNQKSQESLISIYDLDHLPSKRQIWEESEHQNISTFQKSPKNNFYNDALHILKNTSPNPQSSDFYNQLTESLKTGYDKSKSELRHIIIDGSNVAMNHGNKRVFSCKGIEICVNWFTCRGHKDVTVFVPQWRTEVSKDETSIRNQEILYRLENEKKLVFTPSRKVLVFDDVNSESNFSEDMPEPDDCKKSNTKPKYKRIICYDDRYIIKFALEMDGIIVSNDNYRDLAMESPCFARVIEKRLLMYTFINDKFMPPDDPLGRNGPNIDDFLCNLTSTPLSPNLQQSQEKKDIVLPVCPYGPKCTYGSKCKFDHPEKKSKSRKQVTEKQAVQAMKEMEKFLLKEKIGKKALCRTFSLQTSPALFNNDQCNKQNLCFNQTTNNHLKVTSHQQTLSLVDSKKGPSFEHFKFRHNNSLKQTGNKIMNEYPDKFAVSPSSSIDNKVKLQSKYSLPNYNQNVIQSDKLIFNSPFNTIYNTYLHGTNKRYLGKTASDPFSSLNRQLKPNTDLFSQYGDSPSHTNISYKFPYNVSLHPPSTIFYQSNTPVLPPSPYDTCLSHAPDDFSALSQHLSSLNISTSSHFFPQTMKVTAHQTFQPLCSNANYDLVSLQSAQNAFGGDNPEPLLKSLTQNDKSPISSLPLNILGFLHSYENQCDLNFQKTNLLNQSHTSPTSNYNNSKVTDHYINLEANNGPTTNNNYDGLNRIFNNNFEAIDKKHELYYHLSSLFPEHQVRYVMKLYPELTDAKILCSILLKM
ncbi:unnamed protein product [Gordionus sp. m RMFG-2023]|uniref:uncharacterized protein LOC135925241 n=1 Tax=Gordionus sp. m RMFG-2023 TaxID=3053472 RepID=UPI0030E420D6